MISKTQLYMKIFKQCAKMMPHYHCVYVCVCVFDKITRGVGAACALIHAFTFSRHYTALLCSFQLSASQTFLIYVCLFVFEMHSFRKINFAKTLVQSTRYN